MSSDPSEKLADDQRFTEQDTKQARELISLPNYFAETPPSITKEDIIAAVEGALKSAKSTKGKKREAIVFNELDKLITKHSTAVADLQVIRQFMVNDTVYLSTRIRSEHVYVRVYNRTTTHGDIISHQNLLTSYLDFGIKKLFERHPESESERPAAFLIFFKNLAHAYGINLHNIQIIKNYLQTQDPLVKAVISKIVESDRKALLDVLLKCQYVLGQPVPTAPLAKDASPKITAQSIIAQIEKIEQERASSFLKSYNIAQNRIAVYFSDNIGRIDSIDGFNDLENYLRRLENAGVKAINYPTGLDAIGGLIGNRRDLEKPGEAHARYMANIHERRAALMRRLVAEVTPEQLIHFKAEKDDQVFPEDYVASESLELETEIKTRKEFEFTYFVGSGHLKYLAKMITKDMLEKELQSRFKQSQAVTVAAKAQVLLDCFKTMLMPEYAVFLDNIKLLLEFIEDGACPQFGAIILEMLPADRQQIINDLTKRQYILEDPLHDDLTRCFTLLLSKIEIAQRPEVFVASFNVLIPQYAITLQRVNTMIRFMEHENLSQFGTVMSQITKEQRHTILEQLRLRQAVFEQQQKENTPRHVNINPSLPSAASLIASLEDIARKQKPGSVVNGYIASKNKITAFLTANLGNITALTDIDELALYFQSDKNSVWPIIIFRTGTSFFKNFDAQGDKISGTTYSNIMSMIMERRRKVVIGKAAAVTPQELKAFQLRKEQQPLELSGSGSSSSSFSSSSL